MKTWHFFVLLFGVLLGARLCHSGILWEPETLPMAAAAQMSWGKLLYRDIWYDKPPLVPVFYLLAGTGWTMRLAGAIYSLAACGVAFRFARELYGGAAGLWAAGLLAFFLVFDLPVSVVPAGPDMLMLGPHLCAVYLAWKGRVFAGGAAAGVAFLCNTKAVFVLAACSLFGVAAVGGFAVPVLMGAAVMLLQGAWNGYVDQVWIWSAAYAGSTFVEHPVRNGIARTAAWMGFHSGLGGRWRAPWRLWVWLGLSVAAVALGWRFFPRYYLQILAPAVILASGGLARKSWRRYAALLLLLIPAVRFGPRYVSLAIHGDAGWSDTAMDRDSREASAIVKKMARSGDTMFVWGYRPEDWIYTGLPAATKYLDCQALTGVPADRHLTQSVPVTSAGTAEARRVVAASRPNFVMDGLTAFNPRLDMRRYPELKAWMDGYDRVASTAFTVIYRRKAP